MNTIQFCVRCIQACFYSRDIGTYWEIRRRVLAGSRLNKLLGLLGRLIQRRYGCAIPISAEILPFNTPHGFNGIFISREAHVGKGCIILQNVTIGSTTSFLQGEKNVEGNAPFVGDNCLIGAGAVIVGKIKIGNNVKIGAGAVVAQDVPDNSTVVMPRPRIILKPKGWSKNNK